MLSGCVILIATTTTIIIIIIIFIKQCVSWLFNFLVFFSSSSGLSESEYVCYVFFLFCSGLFTLIGSLMVLVSNASNFWRLVLCMYSNPLYQVYFVLGWVWSFGWNYCWIHVGLLLTVTDVPTTCVVVIFWVKVSCISSLDGIILWLLTWLVNYVMMLLAVCQLSRDIIGYEDSTNYFWNDSWFQTFHSYT